jgi:DNA replication protein DnaC
MEFEITQPKLLTYLVPSVLIETISEYPFLFRIKSADVFPKFCHNRNRCENLLAFGNPGSGKTHLLCGIGHELARQGRRVYFSTCDWMVQQLLRAKRELELDKLLKKLSRFEVLMIDDFGYVKQDRDEMEVLFTLLAHRYERGSMLLTSNLPFSKWEVIFKDPMTTTAAIDRLVHHRVVLELNVSSYRAEEAKKKKNQDQ